MNQPRNFDEDTYHHLYNRGANRLKIFFDKLDYQFFKKRMLKYKIKYDVEILSYCLMPNHFHILVRQTSNNNPLNKFISDFINSYTKSINKKYGRSGVLFEGPTKNKIIYDESALPFVAKYILLNPVRAKLCNQFYKYEFSSAKELLNISNDGITDKSILRHFNNDVQYFKEFILSDDEIDLHEVYLKKDLH